ncbi:hypothetical protein ONE63_006102 [Megalurothrips usitatus]|uniref:Uncharacterized protein n=1 Tax=Megalurothrips usitatus TaxID=439358 RepID=A0AAV7XSC7_9NEOP|nr:hypothetical protein ONE63_006102 [Megalurothrips usitatus]
MGTEDNPVVCVEEETTLEEEAYNARLDLSHVRSICPSLCANLLQRTIKNEIVISQTFKVDFENDEPNKPAFDSEQLMENLGLRRKIGFSSRKTKALENQVNQISAALDIISKNKQLTAAT